MGRCKWNVIYTDMKSGDLPIIGAGDERKHGLDISFSHINIKETEQRNKVANTQMLDKYIKITGEGEERERSGARTVRKDSGRKIMGIHRHIQAMAYKTA